MGQGSFAVLAFGIRPRQNARAFEIARAWNEGRSRSEQLQESHEAPPFLAFWIAIAEPGLAARNDVSLFAQAVITPAEVRIRFRRRWVRVRGLWRAFATHCQVHRVQLAKPQLLFVADYD